MNFGIVGSMCQAERDFVEKGNLCKSLGKFSGNLRALECKLQGGHIGTVTKRKSRYLFIESRTAKFAPFTDSENREPHSFLPKASKISLFTRKRIFFHGFSHAVSFLHDNVVLLNNWIYSAGFSFSSCFSRSVGSDC
jgi:hypothetical protein